MPLNEHPLLASRLIDKVPQLERRLGELQQVTPHHDDRASAGVTPDRHEMPDATLDSQILHPLPFCARAQNAGYVPGIVMWRRAGARANGEADPPTAGT
jgi:hypothetical protein